MAQREVKLAQLAVGFLAVLRVHDRRKSLDERSRVLRLTVLRQHCGKLRCAIGHHAV